MNMVEYIADDPLQNETPSALIGEALAKLLCHNVVVLVHDMHELGIAAEYA